MGFADDTIILRVKMRINIIIHTCIKTNKRDRRKRYGAALNNNLSDNREMSCGVGAWIAFGWGCYWDKGTPAPGGSGGEGIS